MAPRRQRVTLADVAREAARAILAMTIGGYPVARRHGLDDLTAKDLTYLLIWGRSSRLSYERRVCHLFGT